MASSTTVTLKAPDISCGHCVAAIKRAVGNLPGVSEVDASTSTKQVRVTFDPGSVSQKTIEDTMADEGYPVAR